MVSEENQSSIELDDSETEQIEVSLLLEAIYQKYGFDFRDYAFSSIKRRILHRTKLLNLQSISELQGKVLYQPEVMDVLLNDFSINVTEMFRDPEFFKEFRHKVIPVLRTLPSIRIWHAGCSSGEEVYSMAILLYEEGLYERTKLYATDMNEDILEKAKSGKFSLHHMKLYTKNYLHAGGKKEFSEYYTVERDYVEFAPFLRKNIIFAHHNLVTDYSFNEFQVIICRNVLIYFNNMLKKRVFDLFYNSLSKDGFLGLGNKESITGNQFSKQYNEIDSREKIYQKLSDHI
nr:protein-glutamate O-methyltransferase CheR [Bacillus alkalicellulosilyticus]